jgi:hypothetical protein
MLCHAIADRILRDNRSGGYRRNLSSLGGSTGLGVATLGGHLHEPASAPERTLADVGAAVLRTNLGRGVGREIGTICIKVCREPVLPLWTGVLWATARDERQRAESPRHPLYRWARTTSQPQLATGRAARCLCSRRLRRSPGSPSRGASVRTGDLGTFGHMSSPTGRLRS